jgi:hypothetical protein
MHLRHFALRLFFHAAQDLGSFGIWSLALSHVRGYTFGFTTPLTWQRARQLACS